MRTALMLGLVVVTNVVLAHPEHAGGGAAGAGLAHLLSEPDHLALLLLPVVVALAIWWLRRANAVRARRARNDGNV